MRIIFHLIFFHFIFSYFHNVWYLYCLHFPCWLVWKTFICFSHFIISHFHFHFHLFLFYLLFFFLGVLPPLLPGQIPPKGKNLVDGSTPLNKDTPDGSLLITSKVQRARNIQTPSSSSSSSSPSRISRNQTNSEIDFTRGSWVSMLKDMNLPPFCEEQMNHESLLKYCIESVLNVGFKTKVPLLVVLVKALVPTEGDYKMVLRDPTGIIYFLYFILFHYLFF